MIDLKLDTACQISDRRADRGVKRPVHAVGGTAAASPRRRHARLAPEALAVREAAQPPPGELTLAASRDAVRGGAAEGAARELALPREPPPDAAARQTAALRGMRLGFAAAAVLVLFLLWLRQRRS